MCFGKIDLYADDFKKVFPKLGLNAFHPSIIRFAIKYPIDHK